MAMESQRSQAQFVISQTQAFVEQGGQEQAEIGMTQEYQYAQQPQPPVQAYPVYQLRPAQMPQQQMAPQQNIPHQPVATPMPGTQVSTNILSCQNKGICRYKLYMNLLDGLVCHESLIAQW